LHYYLSNGLSENIWVDIDKCLIDIFLIEARKSTLLYFKKSFKKISNLIL